MGSFILWLRCLNASRHQIVGEMGQTHAILLLQSFVCHSPTALHGRGVRGVVVLGSGLVCPNSLVVEVIFDHNRMKVISSSEDRIRSVVLGKEQEKNGIDKSHTVTLSLISLCVCNEVLKYQVYLLYIPGTGMAGNGSGSPEFGNCPFRNRHNRRLLLPAKIHRRHRWHE